MSKNNIVGFEQPAEFYYNSALKYLEDYNYIDALPYLRKAVEKDPENSEYSTALAEALTEIGRFDESNSIILDLLNRGSDDSELFFGLGCNYMGLGDLERAGDCFEQYTAAGEEGEFYYDAVEFLNFIEDYKDSGDMPGLFDLDDDSFGDVSADADKEAIAESVQQAMEDSGVSERDLLFMKNNMAMALYYEGRYDEAVAVAEEMLKREPDNVFALCDLILFSAEKQDLLRMTELLAKLEKVHTEDPEAIFKKAVTYCEIKLHERALKEFNECLKFKPFDTGILFMTGIAAANTGDYKYAVDCFAKCLKIDPDDYAAAYYLAEVRKITDGRGTAQEYEYTRKLPDDEADRRLNYINDCFAGDRDEVLKLWREDARFRDYLIWGLYSCDNEYRLAVASVIADFAQDGGEKVLRKYILDPTQPDEVKDQIFIMLKKAGAAEPYRAYLRGGVVEISVSEAPAAEDGEDGRDE